MLEVDEIAASAGVGFDGKKYAGAFSFNATVKGDSTPEELEAAWYRELELLQLEPVSQTELQKVKNNIVADQYRGLQSNFYLMIQLGFFEMVGGGDYINTASGRLLEVSADDIIALANSYFDENNSSVAVYRRAADAEPVDEALGAFSPEQLAMIQQALVQLEALPISELGPAITNMRAQSAQVPPEMKLVFEYLLLKLEERIAETGSEPGVGGVGVQPESSGAPDTIRGSENSEEADLISQNETVLTPEQKIEAEQFITNMETMELTDLVRIYGAMQGVVVSVPDEDRAVVEFLIIKIAARISELEQENK